MVSNEACSGAIPLAALLCDSTLMQYHHSEDHGLSLLCTDKAFSWIHRAHRDT